MKKNPFLFSFIGILIFIQPIDAQTWIGAKRLTWNSALSEHADIATDSSNIIYGVWNDHASGNSEISLGRSTDGGSTWNVKRLTWNAGMSAWPNIMIDSSDNIHIVWHDKTPGNFEIFYKMSTNGGASWINKRLTWSPGDSFCPILAMDTSGTLHLVWSDWTPIQEEIFYKKSTDGGASWMTKRLSWNPGSSYRPVIAVDSSDNIHVFWHDQSPGNYEILYKKSTDGGVSWITKRLTWNSGDSWVPVIAIDSLDTIHMVWNDVSPGNYEIFYKKSTDEGMTWTTKRLTWNYGGSWDPAISVDSLDAVHIVWHDWTPSNAELYYKQSADGGASWSSSARILWNSGISIHPDMAVDSNDNLHIIWQDDTPGNNEIYYKKGIQ